MVILQNFKEEQNKAQQLLHLGLGRCQSPTTHRFSQVLAHCWANSNPPAIGITAFNMASGDFFELSSITGTGFTVHFKNSSGSSVDEKL